MGAHQRITKDEAARRILDVLIEQDGIPISLYELGDRAQLTEGNTNKGVAHLRDELLKIEGVAYVAKLGRSGGVALTKDRETASDYTVLRAKFAATSLRRVLSGTVQPMIDAATTKTQRRDAESIKVSLIRLIEDLDRFILV